MPVRFAIALLALALPGAVSAQLRYTTRPLPDARAIALHACTSTVRAVLRLRADRAALRALDGVSRSDGGDVVRDGASLVARDLPAGACVVARVDVNAIDQSPGPSWRLDPTHWLWWADGEPGVLAFDLPEGWSASVPWSPDARGRYTLGRNGPAPPAATVLGRDVDERTIARGNDRLRVAVIDAGDDARADMLHAWLADLADAATTLHGRLPLPDAQVTISPMRSRGRSPVPWGQSTRGGGAALHLFVREDSTLAELRADWTGAHELAHLFHPYLGVRGRWLSEGLASYYQNVLRARAGMMTPDAAWRALHAGFERGRRDTSGRTLADVSRRMRGGRAGTMRTYWSGAALMLEADLALRRRGQSLDAVLAGFCDCCLPARRRWTPERFVAELDRIAGADVFAPLFERYAASTRFPDLSDAYAALGLDPRSGRVDDDASAAVLRDAIMSPRPDE